MTQFKVNDRTYHYKSSVLPRIKYNIIKFNIFLIRLLMDYLSHKSLSLPVRRLQISAMFVVFKHFLCVFVVLSR